MEVINQAIHFVTDAMSDIVRKGSGKPAVFHALEAGVIASSLTEDPSIIAAALLHDVIEDSGITADTLQMQFGRRVTALVLSETEDKRAGMPPDASWKIRKEEALALLRKTEDMGVKILFLSDKLSNMRSISTDFDAMGEKVWLKFNQKDPEEHHWYYREIATALSGLRETSAWKEYDKLIKNTFNEDGKHE